MTHSLIERMAGHQTRLAQVLPDRLLDGEDQELARYVEQSARMDRAMIALSALVPRGWLLLGMLALAPTFVAGAPSAAGMAVALGGVLLGYSAFRQLVTGLAHLIGAAISWKQVAPLLRAAAQADPVGPPGLVMARTETHAPTSRPVPIVSASDLVYRYRGRAEPVLRGCDLSIWPGDRILLEGPSGGGKSTLASLLSGVRKPDSGLLLLGGLDHHTLGNRGWRSRVACAPQFHENHIFSGTLAFNLLMGRRWPPTPQDSQEAELLCHELGLGELIDRMPGGMMQMIGETGWQLSHGERSRVFIARALLQETDVVLLDESLGALDPQTTLSVMRCALDRAPALMVIAHP